MLRYRSWFKPGNYDTNVPMKCTNVPGKKENRPAYGSLSIWSFKAI